MLLEHIICEIVLRLFKVRLQDFVEKMTYEEKRYFLGLLERIENLKKETEEK